MGFPFYFTISGVVLICLGITKVTQGVLKVIKVCQKLDRADFLKLMKNRRHIKTLQAVVTLLGDLLKHSHMRGSFNEEIQTEHRSLQLCSSNQTKN